jgi:hypothetical protein
VQWFGKEEYMDVGTFLSYRSTSREMRRNGRMHWKRKDKKKNATKTNKMHRMKDYVVMNMQRK